MFFCAFLAPIRYTRLKHLPQNASVLVDAIEYCKGLVELLKMSDYNPEVNSRLLNLTFLTKEERAIIEDVLERDRKIIMQDRIRLG